MAAKAKKTPAPKAKKAPVAGGQNTSQFLTLFPTYIHAVDFKFEGYEAFNLDLAMALYRMRSRDPEGIFRSNMSGTWHSKDTVFNECGEFGQKLGRMFHRSFAALAQKHALNPHPKDQYKMRMAAWCMMYREGGYASPHTHPNCHLSGVYYVDVGEPQEAQRLATNVNVVPGSLEFLDTRSGIGQQMLAGHSLNPGFRAAPELGRMIVFPSGLPHFVHPVKGDGERIAVACNATITEYIPFKEK